ncbi:adenine deaminase C-terminal domain-containing protein [Bacillus horti]|uniref:adenine deaminase n=1 Tax=Caldalkalibacillus horti TaxID=77523 RepID=A0ABT9W1V9_9BACI|nr:adenine deaminase C-terminal domain-containing protein [Bacillus horti]MDQ0167232.1 adenine deaminase [Bacillus horti]
MKIKPLDLKSYQELIQVALRKSPADLWFKNAQFLNVYTGQLQRSHIALSKGRIAYVGDKEPLTDKRTEVVELETPQILVPGYIEPHAHPFQWYNPYTWGRFLVTQGTTTSINDNMALFKYLDDEQALSFIEKLHAEEGHLWLWWSRFDAQTGLSQEENRFAPSSLRRWLKHRLVVQGGEFTSWPLLLKGNQALAEAMLITKQEFHKRVEGHLPGSSPETLNAMAASGVTADHEALSGEDVIERLRLGLYASLRYSSIRPDLPNLLEEIKAHPELNRSRILLTNDGSMPFFVEQSGCNRMIEHVIAAGFSPIEAYRMVTLNPATYYGLEEELGGIAPGRLAHINVLQDVLNPTPLRVMVDGKWVVQNQSTERSHYSEQRQSPQWMKEYFPPKTASLTISSEMLHQSPAPVGIELINEVITKPYELDPHGALELNELYLSLVDEHGKWVLNTRIKNFASNLQALASTYTASSHYLLMGRDRDEMAQVLEHTLVRGGGIQATFTSGDEVWVPLPLAGGMSDEPMNLLMQHSKHFVEKLKENGHPFADPIYTLLFLTATHLPFIRMTDHGLYLIKEQKVIVPSHKL